MLTKEPSFASLLVKQSPQCTTVTAGSWVRMENAGIRAVHKMNCWRNYQRINGEQMAIEGAAATVPLSPVNA